MKDGGELLSSKPVIEISQRLPDTIGTAALNNGYAEAIAITRVIELVRDRERLLVMTDSLASMCTLCPLEWMSNRNKARAIFEALIRRFEAAMEYTMQHHTHVPAAASAVLKRCDGEARLAQDVVVLMGLPDITLEELQKEESGEKSNAHMAI